MKNYQEMLDLIQKISRSACLDQVVGNKCICFSCEAKALLSSRIELDNGSSIELDGADNENSLKGIGGLIG